MKVGIRKPSLKKSIKAKTTGRAKRALKSSVNPLYGKKGMGFVNDPEKAMYNKVYNKTTVGVRDFIPDSNNSNDIKATESTNVLGAVGGIFTLLVGMIQLVFWGGLLIIILRILFKILSL